MHDSEISAEGSPSVEPGRGGLWAPPALETGDHLTRCEFERRYAACSGIKKAELVEGVVYMPSPVRVVAHARPHAALQGLFVVYAAHTTGVSVADNATVRLDLDNEFQPDVVMQIAPEAGGSSRMSDDDYVEGAPELVAEVAASSASLDMHAKRNAYRRNGVQEYIVWRTLDRCIDWFELVDGEYRDLAPNAAGVVESRVFPGLHVATSALLEGDLAAALAELDNGIRSSAHRAFAARLRRGADAG
ncbi:MAG: Uma2 family endonuclease [Gammaproteobacteria bacterium]|nr:Uma2 family endonuclease [Gammaproteobacteria bacterium]